MRQILFSLRMGLLVALMFPAIRGASAATINAAGAHLNLGDVWRDSTVPKPQDLDGDNIYGSLGYIMFNTHTQASGGGVGPTGPLDNATVSLPGYITITATGANAGFQGNYTLIDDPNDPVPGGTDIWSGIAYRSPSAPGGLAGSTEYSLFDITFGVGLPLFHTFRLGIFVDNVYGLQEVPIALRVAGVLGDSGNVFKPAMVQSNDYYFFDLTNLMPGETISVFATTNSDPVALALAGFTFDIVPEPSTIVLGGIGFVLLVFFQLRRIAKVRN